MLFRLFVLSALFLNACGGQRVSPGARPRNVVPTPLIADMYIAPAAASASGGSSGVPQSRERPGLMPRPVEREMRPVTSVPARTAEPARTFVEPGRVEVSALSRMADEKSPKTEPADVAEPPSPPMSLSQNAEAMPQPTVMDNAKLRVGVLAPLSGRFATVGVEMRNAATMAMFNVKTNNIIVQFYDTQSDESGAREAMRRAAREGAEIAIGPLSKDEVAGAKAARAGIPMISFTTDSDVLGGDAFSIGHLLDSQIQRIMEFSAGRGQKRIVILTPSGVSGKFVMKQATTFAKRNNMEIAHSATFERNTITDVAKRIANFDAREAEYKEYANAIEARFAYMSALKADFPDDFASEFDSQQYQSAEAELADLEKVRSGLNRRKTFGEVDFDTVFVFGDDINDVIMVGSMMMFYEVPAGKVRFIGTSQLENERVRGERAFRGAWYPTISTRYSPKFNAAFQQYFDQAPGRIASLTYDAMAVSASVFNQSGRISRDALLNPNGWTGINGIFRFVRSGENERLMDITEIRNGRPVIVENAGTSF